MTESEMLVLLRELYTEKAGNGDAWAFVPHVRNAAGFDATRTIDAVAMALWPSRELALHAIEIKVSRSDWIRELRKPEKAEGFGRLVDFFWIAVSDEAIVASGELPDGWGLLAPRKARGGLRLVAKVEAQRLHPVAVPDGLAEMGYSERKRAIAGTRGPLDRSFVAALLRSACRVSKATPAEVEAAVARALEDERQRSSLELERMALEVEKLRHLHQRIELAAGIPISHWLSSSPERADDIGRAVKAALNGVRTAEQIEDRLRAVRDHASRIAAEAAAAVDQLSPVPAHHGMDAAVPP